MLHTRSYSAATTQLPLRGPHPACDKQPRRSRGSEVVVARVAAAREAGAARPRVLLRLEAAVLPLPLPLPLLVAPAALRLLELLALLRTMW